VVYDVYLESSVEQVGNGPKREKLGRSVVSCVNLVGAKVVGINGAVIPDYVALISRGSKTELKASEPDIFLSNFDSGYLLAPCQLAYESPGMSFAIRECCIHNRFASSKA
jgi:hypothetical protein